jgi:uncharacterized coiled-coil DUF342 family protein
MINEGELDELKQRMDTFEDETVDGIRSDIDYLKDEVKNVTIPSDLNEKWNSVRDNANQVSGLRDDLDSINGLVKEMDDAVGDRRNEIEQLQQDRDDIKEDIGGIKDNATYLENEVIQSLRDEVSEHYDEFIQLQQKVQQLQTSSSGGAATQGLPYPVSLVYDITSEEWTQLIFFLLSAVHYSGNLNLQTFKNQCEIPDGDPADIFREWMDVLRAAKNSYW